MSSRIQRRNKFLNDGMEERGNKEHKNNDDNDKTIHHTVNKTLLRQALLRFRSNPQLQFFLICFIIILFVFVMINQHEKIVLSTKFTTSLTTSQQYYNSKTTIIYPRIISISGQSITNFTVPSRMIVLEEEHLDGLQSPKYYSQNGVVESAEETTKCPFIAEWQRPATAPLTCNILHEVGMRVSSKSSSNQMNYLDSGAFKDVWKIKQFENQDNLILKTTVYSRKFNAYDLDKHRRDALVMERATSSPYVLDMYGYCLYSSIVEEAVNGHTLHSWLDNYRETASPMEILQVATQLAQGVVDMHLYHNGMATVAHADIKASQYLITKRPTSLTTTNSEIPHFKINDFNRCRLLTSKSPPIACPFTMGNSHKSSTSRSPEEYTNGGLQTDKVDVYSLGSLLYYLLVGHVPFARLPFRQAIEEIKKDVKPEIPERFTSSDAHPAIKVIVEQILICRQFKASDRPNSKQVADALWKVYHEQLKLEQQQ